MKLRMHRLALLFCLLSLLGAVSAPFAGGPIVYDESTGEPFRWLESRGLFHMETGPLGAISNATAVEAVREGFKRWTDIPTAAVTFADGGSLGIDVTGEDFVDLQILFDFFNDCVAREGIDCTSPVIFDNDGSITALLFGEDAGVVAFAGPFVATIAPPFLILEAEAVFNGIFFDSDPSNSFGRDFSQENFLGPLVHEFGHFAGISHSKVNGDRVFFDPVAPVNPIGNIGIQKPTLFAPIDNLIRNSIDSLETMYPFTAPEVGVAISTPAKNDIVALSSLYPSDDFFVPSSSPLAINLPSTEGNFQTGAVSGRVLFQDGSPAQGANVVARNVEDPLNDAVSQLSGAFFAPRRCSNGQSIGDLCDTDAQCQESFDPNSVCGFVSSFGGAFGRLTPGPAELEGFYILTGLTPGARYIIGISQAARGSFSSPVLANPSPSSPLVPIPRLLSFVFPNPPTGEFFNGENESGDPLTDNPFAATPMLVQAGTAVENVDIIFNSGNTSADLAVDPGFDFCGLADVNGDSRVNLADITTVVAALGAKAGEQAFSSKADINDDGVVSFFDLDVITDMVAGRLGPRQSCP